MYVTLILGDDANKGTIDRQVKFASCKVVRRPT